MIEKKIIIKDPIGFHARPATVFSKTASKFASEINVTYHNKKVNGKSSLSLIALGVKQNESILLTIKGVDEHKALDAIIQVLDNLGL